MYKRVKGEFEGGEWVFGLAGVGGGLREGVWGVCTVDYSLGAEMDCQAYSEGFEDWAWA